MYGLIPFRQNPAEKIKLLIDSIFDDDFNEMLPFSFFDTLRTDIKETENEYIIEAELPGFEKENIDVEVTDNNLLIRAIRNKEIKEESKEYIRRERYSGNFERRFYIENIKPQEAKAKYENGILKIVLPKDQKGKNETKIKIE